ncbi:MAG: hypothetical protein IKO33_04565, partial [Bacteroidaceae bacterium]|nr:hypothetical protein [Bacteroidaceae bacterium]
MRKTVLLLALTSMLMSLCIPAIAQQPQSDSTVSLSQLTAEMIEKVKVYEVSGKLEEYEYIIEIKQISADVNIDSKGNKIFQVP